MKALYRFAPIIALLVLTGFVSAQQSDRDRGIDLYRESKFADAIPLLQQAVAADATDRVAWIFLGGAYVHTDERAKANAAFGKSNVRPVAPTPKYDKSVKVTYKPRASYTEEARARMSSGTVRIAVEFRSDGKIGFTFPLQTTVDPDLVRQSVDAARGITFEPAAKDGKPVTVINIVEYGFRVG